MEIKKDLDFEKVMRVLKNPKNYMRHINSLRRYIDLYCEKWNDYMLQDYLIYVMHINVQHRF